MHCIHRILYCENKNTIHICLRNIDLSADSDSDNSVVIFNLDSWSKVELKHEVQFSETVATLVVVIFLKPLLIQVRTIFESSNNFFRQTKSFHFLIDSAYFMSV